MIIMITMIIIIMIIIIIINNNNNYYIHLAISHKTLGIWSRLQWASPIRVWWFVAAEKFGRKRTLHSSIYPIYPFFGLEPSQWFNAEQICTILSLRQREDACLLNPLAYGHDRRCSAGWRVGPVMGQSLGDDGVCLNDQIHLQHQRTLPRSVAFKEGLAGRKG